jgi:4-aminobutyrate aminotransferase-like enzyme
MTETYQGGGPDFLPVEYAQKLEAFCREHDIVMCYDEVQAGFGRTGKMFGYEHYGVRPDLIACGKGISSSLPISAVIGREDIMEMYSSRLDDLDALRVAVAGGRGHRQPRDSFGRNGLAERAARIR